MTRRLVVLDELRGRPAAALMVDNRLDDLLIAPPDGVPAPGAIHRAKTDRQIKGLGGVFLKLSSGTAFLRQPKSPAPGQSMLVQVTGFAEPGKAVPVTGKLLFKSRYAIVTPQAPGLNVSRRIRDDEERERLQEIAHEGMAKCGFGLILRSACAGANEGAIAEDIAAMRDLAEAVMSDGKGDPELLLDAPDAHDLAWREWSDPPPDEVVQRPGAFAEYGVLDAIEALAGPAPLAGGGSIHVEPTRALVAVDVNTGPDTTPAAGLKANLAAARELPRQLRLRGLGGQITVDFAPMPKKDRRQLEQVLRAAFRADPVETALVGWTTLGNFEMQRKRERLPVIASVLE